MALHYLFHLLDGYGDYHTTYKACPSSSERIEFCELIKTLIDENECIDWHNSRHATEDEQPSNMYPQLTKEQIGLIDKNLPAQCHVPAGFTRIEGIELITIEETVF